MNSVTTLVKLLQHYILAPPRLLVDTNMSMGSGFRSNFYESIKVSNV